MKRHALFLGLLCLSALLIAASKLNALTIPASEDSYTAPRNTLSYSTNNANSLIVDATRKSYLYFDLSDIPADAVVRWAKLRLFLPTVRTAGAGLSVHLVTGTWNESTRLADVPSISAGSLGMIAPDKMASRRFVTVDVKDTVQKWINGGTLNEGFAIQPIIKPGSPTASVMLTSKEGPVFGLPAELDIEFQPEGGVDKLVTLGQLSSEVRALLSQPQIAFDQLHLSLRTFLSPAIISQPVYNPTFHWSGLSVQAQGVGNLSYQWLRNGIPIAGGTSSRLPQGFLQAGTYTVVVSNGLASATSLSVQFDEAKFEDQFALVFTGSLPTGSELGTVPVGTFYIGRTEVTWGEWRSVRAWATEHGYSDLENVGAGVGDNYPVTNVNWYDCVKWCNARSEKEGKTAVYAVNGEIYREGEGSSLDVNFFANGYRLPREKEWEFAARGGTQSNGYTYSGSNALDVVGWYSTNSGGTLHEVGEKQANELRIYDMSGNALEWTEPLLRGGFWDSNSGACTVVSTTGSNLGDRSLANGFRVTTSGEAPIAIMVQPAISSDGTSINVQAQGAGPLNYQWMRNGEAILGQTGTELPTASLQSGTYSVMISNEFSSAKSAGIPFPPLALVTGGTVTANSFSGASYSGIVSVGTFYIGRTEVTWGEWRSVRAWATEHGYSDLENVGAGVDHHYPVTANGTPGWYAMVKWCNAKSEKEGKKPVYKLNGDVYRIGAPQPEWFEEGGLNRMRIPNLSVTISANGYRLPSEAEWVFAARGGNYTHGYLHSGSSNFNSVGWNRDNSRQLVHSVAEKQANELGIFDMSGNVWERCWYSEKGFRLWGGAFDRPLYAVGQPASHLDSGGFSAGFRIATTGKYALSIEAQPWISSNGAVINVQAEGDGALTYQWMQNGILIAAGTNSQLSTEGLLSGTYAVVVSNGFASVTSQNIEYRQNSEYPSPIGGLALVSGGSLPTSSVLGAVHVSTFYIGKAEVTWGDWQRVRTWAVARGYTDLPNVGQGVGDNYPVTSVNWYDVVKWCNAWSEKEGKTPVYKNGSDVYRSGAILDPQVVTSANGYRLPTEAEWEFAARGGTQSNGYTYSGGNDFDAVGWFYENAGLAVHEVSKKQANELGIYDMSGNLWEWSGSWYPGSEGSARVIRGGGWGDTTETGTFAYRYGDSPEVRDLSFGFRVALSAAP